MLTKPQIESREMKKLRIWANNSKKGIIIYTASTMEEQREIAEYINQIDGRDYEIFDFSQKEQHLMNHPLTREAGSKIIISNMQEIGVAPYCKPDSKATVTLQDKIEWMNRRIEANKARHEGMCLLSINLVRDSFFRNRKVICGMHPNFFEKMQHLPYLDYIDDWLDYARMRINFNENPEFVQCLPITNFRGENQVQVHDMVFVFQNKVVRWPEFDVYQELTDEEYREKLQHLPEISFPEIEKDREEREY